MRAPTLLASQLEAHRIIVRTRPSLRSSPRAWGSGYVYEALVECSEYRAALNTSPEEKEAKTWVRAYMLGLGIALLVVSG